MSRADRIADFLRAAGWAGAESRPLAGDASPRVYARLSGGPGGAGAVLMDADPALGASMAPFLAMTGWLRARGFSAPDVYAADAEAGLALIEDLGDGLYARVCAADPAAEPALYDAALDALLAVQSEPPPPRVEGFGCVHAPIDYDATVLRREARLALDWWAPAAGSTPAPDAAAEYDALIAAATARAASDRRALVMLDYHAENLLWLPARRGVARVGLLDYQDARIGPPVYDLVSLTGDARRDVSPAVAAALFDRWAAARGEDPGAARADAAALSAQRCLKILGIFARLALRDGKRGHLAHLPRVWRVLKTDLAHPALAGLSGFVDRWVPAPAPDALSRLGLAA